MKSHQLIDHVADIRLKVTGDTLEELFNAALEGMAELIKKDVCLQKGYELLTFELQSLDTTTLLIDFLSQVLGYTHVRKHVYCSATFEKLTSTSLKVTLTGILVQDFDEDIKAVTYHEAEVRKDTQGMYETIIIFDI